jgi:hypothetical protein
MEVGVLYTFAYWHTVSKPPNSVTSTTNSHSSSLGVYIYRVRGSNCKLSKRRREYTFGTISPSMHLKKKKKKKKITPKNKGE